MLKQSPEEFVEEFLKEYLEESLEEFLKESLEHESVALNPKEIPGVHKP